MLSESVPPARGPNQRFSYTKDMFFAREQDGVLVLSMEVRAVRGAPVTSTHWMGPNTTQLHVTPGQKALDHHAPNGSQVDPRAPRRNGDWTPVFLCEMWWFGPGWCFMDTREDTREDREDPMGTEADNA